ncbi:MAG: hypothetical protein QM820_59815 [Minicystis sp.]
MIAPAANEHAPPEGGTIDVAFLASDPSGLAGGAVQIDGADPVPIPLASLAVSVPIPGAKDLPATPQLTWWFDDAVGNRTQGTVPLVQTHERFRQNLEMTGQSFVQPDGRLVVVESSLVRAYEKDGSVAWTMSAGAQSFGNVIPAAGGDFLLVRSSQGDLGSFDEVLRLHADGAVAWKWPESGVTTLSAMAYVAASDSLVVVVLGDVTGAPTSFLIGPAGHETVVASSTEGTSVWPVATPAGATPGGFALGTSTSGPDFHFDVFDAAGAPVWSCDLANVYPLPLLMTRDALLGAVQTSNGYQQGIQRPGLSALPLGIGKVFTLAPNGDFVTTPNGGSDDVVTRYRPDGSVAWQVPMGAPVTALVASGDRVAVTMGTALRIVDAAGGTVDWIPDADPWLPTSPTAALDASGGFYVVGALASLNQRVYRAAADGTTLWHETVYEKDMLRIEPVPAGDGRLVFSMFPMSSVPRVHVFEP